MKRSGWVVVPVAFFFVLNFSISEVKPFFFIRSIYFLFLIFSFFILRKINLNRILNPVIGGISVILFIHGIVQKFVLFPIYLKNIPHGDSSYMNALITRIKSGRIYSIFALPSLYAIVCAVLLIFIFHYFLKSKRNKIFWGFLLFMGLFNLVLTQSFGGILYLSIGLIIYLLISGIIKLKHLAPVIMVISLFFFIVIGLRYSEAKKLEPAKLRFSNWNQAFRMINTSPFWGVGLGNYESKISYFTKSREARSIYAHNFFLQFISETGVILPVFFLLILFFSRKRLKPENHKEKILYISAFFILLAYNFFDIGLYFFTAGILTTAVLSQIYPEKGGKYYLKLAVLAVLSVFLLYESIADNFQKKGEFLLNQGEIIRAEKFYKKSINSNPFNINSLAKFSYIQYLKNKRQESEKYLNRAFRLYPFSAFVNDLKSKIENTKRHALTTFYHASGAYNKNKLNKEYRKRYETIKNKLQIKLSESRD